MLSKFFLSICFKRSFSTRLVEIGCLHKPIVTEGYKTGQLFIHRLFGYRGVILFNWKTTVYDRGLSRKLKDTVAPEELEIRKKLMDEYTAWNIYYTVLMDERDFPFVKAQTSSVTFLANSFNGKKTFYSIPGMNYVPHEDILPYTSTEDQPLQNFLIKQFFIYEKDKYPQFKAQENLLRWDEQNRSYLEVCEVYKETTEDIKVTVIPFFMGTQNSLSPKVYWWRYWVCLENVGDMAVQLKRRFWKIFNLTGGVIRVRGRGILGQQPVLSSTEPGFQYSSFVNLTGPEGHMCGMLSVKRDDGHVFDCKIPNFPLRSRELNEDCSSQSD